MIQWVVALGANLTTLVWSLEPIWWKERISSHKLSFDLHMRDLTQASPHTCTHDKYINVGLLLSLSENRDSLVCPVLCF